MRYAGWNFEKTLLVRETANIARTGELVDVRLAVETDRAGNLANDVRVILKKDWNVLDREVPCQVHRIEQHGETTTFRVAFHLDLPAGGQQRIGVYYDNANARAAEYQTSLEVSGAGLGYRIDTPFYTVETDERSGQLKSIFDKIDDQGATNLRRIDPPGRVQEGNVVIFAVNCGGAWTPVPVSAADWDSPAIVETTEGPLFFKQTRRGRLVPPGLSLGDWGPQSHQAWPELEITYKFFAELPFILVHSRMTFPGQPAQDTDVFGVYNDVLSLGREQFSHYTFRPVSPSLPLTDVEEMGHILVDPVHGGDLPLGVAFSDLLPIGLAWHAFINIHPHKEHAMCGIQLASRNHSPAGQPVTYRPATYLVREEKAVQWFRAPIYVHTRDREENVIRVPAGTVFEELNALCFSGWDQGWGQRVDAMGKQLNNPLEVSAHPIYLGRAVPPEEFEPLPMGQRADAYLRAGVR